MGYEEIVLCGVDLYDRRYFFLSNEETHVTDLGRGETKDSKHSTSSPVTTLIKAWLPVFEKKELIFLYITLSLFCQKYYQSSIRTITKLISILM